MSAGWAAATSSAWPDARWTRCWPERRTESSDWRDGSLDACSVAESLPARKPPPHEAQPRSVDGKRGAACDVRLRTGSCDRHGRCGRNGAEQMRLCTRLPSGTTGIYAATSHGLMRSQDGGQSWSQMHAPQLTEARFIAAHQQMVAGVQPDGLALSRTAARPGRAVMPRHADADWRAGGRRTREHLDRRPEGVFYSTDRGATWKTLRNLFVRACEQHLLRRAEQACARDLGSWDGWCSRCSLPDYKVQLLGHGMELRFVRPVGDHLIGATLFDGIVVQPRMVDSPFAGRAPLTARSGSR